MKIKYMLACLAVATAAVIPTASADSLSQKQQKARALQSAVASSKNQEQTDQQKANSLQADVNSYAASIDTVQQQAGANQAQIKALTEQLQTLKSNIAKDEQQMQAYQNELSNDVRIMYEDGSTSYLDVLFQATNFSDLMDRMYALSVVSQHQKDLVKQVQTLRDNLVKEQASKSQTVSTLQKKQHDYDLLISTQKTLQAQKKQALAEVSLKLQQDRSKRYTLESQLQLTQAQIQQIEDETRSADQKMSNPTYVQQAEQSLSSVDVSSLIHYSEQFIGTPYVWGGTSPHPGFDCSGFTQYVFRHFGVSLNRTAAGQYAQGVPVSRSQLQPGDLVFFSTYAPGATHVGIYVGGGCMVNSEDAGNMITSLSNPYWAARYIGARRVLKG